MRTIEKLQLDGGCSALNFTNTVNTRKPELEFDYLQSYDDFLRWSAKVGSLPQKRLRVLKTHAIGNESKAAAVFKRVQATRENLYKLFLSISKGETPGSSIIKQFNESLSHAFAHITIRLKELDVEVNFNTREVSLDEPVWTILKSAYDVLTKEDLERIRECPRCGWLFLDTSKNGRRRWCNMKVCGGRNKALEYYYRKKAS